MMNSLLEHLNRQFSNVYITFLSVLIGFALEDLFSTVRDTTGLFEISTIAAIVWLQIIFTLMATVGGWMHYTTVAMLRNSIAKPVDTINILQFTISLFIMNATIGYETLGWFWLGASMYLVTGALATWGAVSLLSQENEQFDPYVTAILSLKGPLPWNFVGAIAAAIIGYGILVNAIPHWFIISAASLGCFVLIIWYFWVYHIWDVQINKRLLRS